LFNLDRPGGAFFVIDEEDAQELANVYKEGFSIDML
jgi:hypothetical protein